MALSSSLLPLLVVPALVASAPETLTPIQRQQFADSFERVWTTVRDRHWDPQLGGLDWQKVHDELKPRLDRAGTVPEARAILSEMLGRLGQSHFSIVPAEVYSDLQGEKRGGCTPGLDVRVIQGKALVTRVEPDSSAGRAGVGRGWEVVRVDGKECAAVLRRIEARFKASTELDAMARMAVLSLLSGPAASEAELELSRGSGDLVRLKLRREPPPGKTVAFGNMPPMPFWLEHRTLPGEVRYLRFNIWLEPEAVQEAFQSSLAEADRCRGFVIDLRGNPGGVGGMAMGAAGWFATTPGQKLGTMIMRGTKLNFVVFPRPATFKGPVAILVDGCSASTSEIFAGGMQDGKRARIFGTRTAGAALPSMFERLPNGDGFQYAIANYVSEGGQVLEGRGVIPDQVIQPSQQELLAGKDPVLDQALAWIQTTSH
jgi:carboxyl-terminal processing protease